MKFFDECRNTGKDRRSEARRVLGGVSTGRLECLGELGIDQVRGDAHALESGTNNPGIGLAVVGNAIDGGVNAKNLAHSTVHRVTMRAIFREENGAVDVEEVRICIIPAERLGGMAVGGGILQGCSQKVPKFQGLSKRFWTEHDSSEVGSDCGTQWLGRISPMFSPQVLDHFQNPRHAGEVEGASAVAEMENPACGDVLRLTARIVDGRIEEIRFRAKGCVASMACASQLVEMVQGESVNEARRLRREDLVERLGGLPEASSHAGHLAIDALRELLASA